MNGPLSHLDDWPRGQHISRCEGCGDILASEVKQISSPDLPDSCRFTCGADNPCGWTGPWGEHTWEGRSVLEEVKKPESASTKPVE